LPALGSGYSVMYNWSEEIYKPQLSAPFHGGLDPFPSPPPRAFQPSSSPKNPPRLGTGHTRLGFCPGPFSLATIASSPSSLSSTRRRFPGFLSAPSSSAHFRRCRRLRCGCPCPSGLSPSANATLGAGHGRTWGRPTTKKLKKRVVAKSVEVRRLRGCRCDGMTGSEGENEWSGTGDC
jgi:hypothetical protein